MNFCEIVERIGAKDLEFEIIYIDEDLISLSHLTGEKSYFLEIEDNSTKTHYDKSVFQIYDLLGAFSNKETLEGNNKYQCTK